MSGVSSGRTPRITGPQLIRAFIRAGWEHYGTAGDHYKFRHPERPGMAIVPYHNRTLHLNVIKTTLKTAQLSLRELQQML
jgi:predicted RNA binding protein YcfA (HicA-like mRNA interferase family)